MNNCCLAAGDLAGLQAGCAHVLTFRGFAHQRADSLDVWVPAALGAPVRVRDGMAEARPLAADVACGSHGALLTVKTRFPNGIMLTRRARLP